MERQNNNLRTFIQTQLKLRRMSIREFATFVGVGHSTISRLLDERDESEPSLDVLAKIAAATRTDISELIYLLYPAAKRGALTGSTAVVADLFERLPEDQKPLFIKMLGAAVSND